MANILLDHDYRVSMTRLDMLGYKTSSDILANILQTPYLPPRSSVASPFSPKVRRLKELLPRLDPTPAPAVTPYPAPKRSERPSFMLANYGHE
jgi:hypothetical protein